METYLVAGIVVLFVGFVAWRVVKAKNDKADGTGGGTGTGGGVKPNTKLK
jgi:uncharacterized spore protein YtfJ